MRAASSPRLISQSATGRMNRTRLLQILYDVGPASRAELARIAEVTKTTIGSIVQPMLDEGILVEGEPVRASALGGKPARPIWFSPAGRPIVSVHVGPGTVRAALVSPTGAIRAHVHGTFSGMRASHQTITDVIATCIDDVLAVAEAPPLGVGVAVGGMVDTDQGRIVEVNLAPKLSGLAIGPLLSQRLGLPVHVDLHPRVQALGDRWFGAGRSVSSFASVYCGEAIGAGFVIDGSVHRGAAGAGGEVGHTIVDLGGAVCRCGRRGCWETIATLRWLQGAAASAGLPGARTLTTGPLLALAEAETPGAAELLERYARNVAVGLVNLQQTLAPGLFILHGDVVQGGERFRALIERYVILGVAPHPGGEPRIVFASTADDVTLLGAAGLVLSESLELLDLTRAEIARATSAAHAEELDSGFPEHPRPRCVEVVPAGQLDERAVRRGIRQPLRPREDRVFAAGGEQDGLGRRMRRIGVCIAQAHALGERDERTQVVARDPLGERDVVARDGVFDRCAVLGVGTRLLDPQSRERAPVGDAAEHRPLDAVGHLHGDLPTDARTERVPGVEHRVEQVRVEHRDEIVDERIHAERGCLVRLVARAVPTLVDAEHAEARSREVAHPPRAHPVVSAARREPVHAQHGRRILVAPQVGGDAAPVGRHHHLR